MKGVKPSKRTLKNMRSLEWTFKRVHRKQKTRLERSKKKLKDYRQ